MPAADRNPPRFSAVRIALACGVLALVLRLLAAQGDLWLDEIWSADAAAGIHALADVYRLRSDNNHPLNTAWLAIVGPDALPLIARLPAVVMSSAGVVFGALLVRRRGRAAVAGAGLAGAIGFLGVQYGSEARGYGPALGCALGTAWTLVEFLDAPRDRRLRWGVAYAALATLGTQTHAVFLPFLLSLAAAGLWMAGRGATREKFSETRRSTNGVSPLAPALSPGGRGRAVLGVVGMNLLPAVVAVAMAVGFYGKVKIEGGTIYPPVLAITQALSAWAGGGLRVAPPDVVAFVAGAALVGLIVWRFIARDKLAVLFLLTIGVTPLAWGAARWAGEAPLLYPRYFVLPLAMASLLLGAFIGQAFEGRWPARGAAGLLALLLGGLALNHDARLIRDGRGNYTDAVAYMLDRSAGQTVTVTSNHHFRATKILGHLLAGAPPGTLTYIDGPADRPPRWIILFAEPTDPPAAPEIDGDGIPFTHAKTFPAYGLSGWRWELYQRVEF